MPTPSPPPAPAPRQRRLLALIAAVILAALATLGWQMRPVRRNAFPPAAPQVFAPAPPWAPLGRAASQPAAHTSRWPIAGGDGSVRFVDVAASAGIKYRWTIPGPRPLDILQTIGNGCALLDYDNSGHLSVLLIGTDHLALFRGDGRGHFTDVSHQAGLDTLRGHFLGCAVGDYDNDGYEDVYVSGYRTGLLLHNEAAAGGGRRFRDVTAQAGLRPQPWGTACAFADVDGDGRLDLFVGNYAKFDPAKDKRLCEVNGHLTACGPLTFGSDWGVLYHNEGGGKFRDVSASWHLDDRGKTLGAAFADYDGSGHSGLALANDEVYGELDQNLGNTFKEVGLSHGEALDFHAHFHAGMGIDWGDYDNDGKLDQVVTTYQGEPKSIYHNEGQGFFKDKSDFVGLAVVGMPYVSFGVKWLDFDNSGWLGLMLASGHVEDNAAQVDPSTTYRQPTLLFRNLRGRRFADLSTQAGPDLQRPLVGRGLAVGDFDNDGRVDALVVDSEGAPLLLRNESRPVGHWLSLTLEGTKSNRDGLGTLVTATAGGLTQTRLCHTDGSYLSASDKRVHLGLGKASVAETVRVQWPSGRVDVLHHVRGDRQITIKEGVSP